MKLNSALLYVSSLQKTHDFYALLGGKVSIVNSMSYVVEIGGFTLQCVDQAKAVFAKDSNIQPKGAGVFFYIEVEDVDLTYRELLEKGLTPSSKPKDWEWGNREFVIKDLDGYKFVFYAKLKS